MFYSSEHNSLSPHSDSEQSVLDVDVLKLFCQWVMCRMLFNCVADHTLN